MSSPRSVSYEVHEGAEGLHELRSAWESLEATGIDHIFQTYAHAELWQRTVGEPTGAKPLLIALREDHRIVGIFPACRVRQNGVPLLTWLGAPRVLDYGDVVFDAAAADTRIDDFIAQSIRLLKQHAWASLLYLTNVREDARAFDALRSRLRVLKEAAAPFVPVVGTWEEYLASRGHRLCRELKRQERHMLESYRGVFELLDSTDARVATALEALVGFQRARFAGTFNRTHLFDECHTHFRTEQAADPHYRVATLQANGVCIAVELCAVFRGRFYDLAPGFDRDYSRLSPGFLLNAFIIRSCFENGWDPFDFGWGEEAYKYRWTDNAMRLTTFVNDDMRGAVLAVGLNLRQKTIGALGRLRKTPSTAPS